MICMPSCIGLMQRRFHIGFCFDYGFSDLFHFLYGEITIKIYTIIVFTTFVFELMNSTNMKLVRLVSYNLTRRLKEFSVRKVFGANLFQIFRLMNRDYIWIILIAFALGAPAGAYLMRMMIKSAYPEHIPISAWPFVITMSVMVTTVAITIATQLKRVAKESPTITLRNEYSTEKGLN